MSPPYAAIISFSLFCLFEFAAPAKDRVLHNCAFTQRQGIQTVQLQPESNPFDVFCEQQVFHGGWTVILDRFDGRVDFFKRSLLEYRRGFGNMFEGGEFFLGLDKLYALTNARKHEALFVMQDFRNASFTGSLDYFRIADLTMQFQVLNVGNFAGPHNTVIGPCAFLSADDDTEYQAKRGWYCSSGQEPSLFGDYGKVSYGLCWNDDECELDPSKRLRSLKMLIRPVNLYYSESLG